MSTTMIEPDKDGYYYPSNEKEIINLVRHAYEHNIQLRVRGGSGHLNPKVMQYMDISKLEDSDISTIAPTEKIINVRLNRYNQLVSYDKEHSLVTVQAGMHLIHDRNDPRSKEEESLVYLLHHRYGMALDDLGGVTRQTVSGFLCTGSSGGSLTYDLKENVYAIRIIDGSGQVYEVSRSNPDFNAALVSLGLLGVISTVTFKCPKTFNIQGTHTCTTVKECEVDIFNDNPTDGKKTGLVPFFKEADYARILWWPQQSKQIDIERQQLLIWRAQKIEPTPGFKPKPFKLFESTELMKMHTYLMSMMGNIGNLDSVAQLMTDKESRFDELMQEELMGYKFTGDGAEHIKDIMKYVFDVVKRITTNVFKKIPPSEREKYLPVLSTSSSLLFAPLENYEFQRSQPLKFQDYWWHGLPMDNPDNDVIVPDTSIEVWIPLHRATEATRALKTYFEDIDPEIFKSAYKNIVNNMWELSTSKPSSAWMSMSYSNGKDEWRDGAFRINPNCFFESKQSARQFFQPLWERLHREGIPFRLHWAELMPSLDDQSHNWPESFNYTQTQKFLDLRKQKDPKGIFVSEYSKRWFDV